jgi:hypothetical protein
VGSSKRRISTVLSFPAGFTTPDEPQSLLLGCGNGLVRRIGGSASARMDAEGRASTYSFLIISSLMPRSTRGRYSPIDRRHAENERWQKRAICIENEVQKGVGQHGKNRMSLVSFERGKVYAGQESCSWLFEATISNAGLLLECCFHFLIWPPPTISDLLESLLVSSLPLL